MADRTRDQYQKWGQSRLLSAILTELENVVYDGLRTRPDDGIGVLARSQEFSPAEQEWINKIQGTYTIHLCIPDVAATTGVILVDLSDTTKWPHNEEGDIYVTSYQISMSPETTFVGQVLIGFLSEIDDTDGHFRPILCWKIDKQAQDINEVNSFSDGPIRCNTEDTLVFGNAADTTFQTDVALISPVDTVAPYSVFPGEGDLVLKIVRTAAEISVGVTIKYFVA